MAIVKSEVKEMDGMFPKSWENTYSCGWPGCDNVFTIVVGKGSQVICPKCGNGQKTHA